MIPVYIGVAVSGVYGVHCFASWFPWLPTLHHHCQVSGTRSHTWALQYHWYSILCKRNDVSQVVLNIITLDI